MPRLKQLSKGGESSIKNAIEQSSIKSWEKQSSVKNAIDTNLTDFNATGAGCSKDSSHHSFEVSSSKCHRSQQNGKEKLTASYKNVDDIQIPSDDDLDIDNDFDGDCDVIDSFQRIEPETNEQDEDFSTRTFDNDKGNNCRFTSKRMFADNCSPENHYCFKRNLEISQQNTESGKADSCSKLSGESRQSLLVSSNSNRSVAKNPVLNNDCLDVTKRSIVPSNSSLKFKENRSDNPSFIESDMQSLGQEKVDKQDSRAEQDVTPLKKRTFPGPAGLLPKLSTPSGLDKVETPKHNSLKKRILTPKVIHSPVMLSGKDDGDFKKPFWLGLQKQAIGKFKGLVYHTISMVLRKSHLNQLNKGKVPLMCALIKAFTVNGSDASIILKDPTGEIQGTIHKRVLDHYQAGLCPGSGLILKQVSIFSPSARKHYVNITPSNIMLLLPAESPMSSSFQDSQCSQDQAKLLETNREDPQFSTAHNEEEQDSATEAKELDNIFAADDDFDSWIDDSEFLQEITPELCS
eukprot:Seg1603.6_Seg1603.8 transcript_id=Seg1603.6_Seg1603.8/GoldUCD/mRNA.D3Y31 product="putative protein C17orf53-like" protein_id=Seg1603.6_Seg1603.8/GoldUCD/D3Y31